ncbi:glutathione hydrolase 1 proenzyme-like isoform X2 [Cyprinus carpio]|uniref:Glutathione hydrolase n=1 Tax=Cyprinus carpio TaxID=7962 RepID=A0A9Q9VZ73_CYPCA|nr:glutathione hydrolase 1 proenzyme-like isoform X2 [Cyprinus carpio]
MASWMRYLLVALGIILIVGLTLALILTLTLKPTVTATLTATVPSSDKCYTTAVVAADAGTCSEIGRDILKTHKGSVVDAAIATLLCLSLVNAQSMGIGGGVVFTIYNASTGTVETINARETAPMNASENMFGNGTEKKPAVPGELHGYKLAHERYGRLNWSELFQPSIKLARDGFKIGKALAKAIKENEKDILKNAALCEVFCKSNTIILKENDYISFPKLAHTYEKIANYGISAFYNGLLTQGIVDDIKDQGGIITREDLMNYKPVLNESALNFTVGKYIFLAPDAPFGGPVLALILNILKGYNLSSSSVSPIRNKTLTYHRIIEAFRFANEKKSKLGDPSDESIRESVLQLVKNMTSESTANGIRSKIKDDIKQVKYDDNEENYPDDDRGTSHLSIIGEDGSAVAVTSSINDYFGSKVRSNSTGIIFNDQMNDFCKPKQENECNKNNRIKPGKRPLSSMCPTIILDKHSGQVKMVVGGEGGTNITTSVAQVILNYLLFGYDLQKAIEKPRVQIMETATNVEDHFDVRVTNGLRLKNHTIFHNAEVAVVQAVVREGDKVCAESDYRKGGYPAGYPEPIL